MGGVEAGLVWAQPSFSPFVERDPIEKSTVSPGTYTGQHGCKHDARRGTLHAHAIHASIRKPAAKDSVSRCILQTIWNSDAVDSRGLSAQLLHLLLWAAAYAEYAHVRSPQWEHKEQPNLADGRAIEGVKGLISNPQHLCELQLEADTKPLNIKQGNGALGIQRCQELLLKQLTTFGAFFESRPAFFHYQPVTRFLPARNLLPASKMN
eukprot:3554076-Amphidinium_carterae.1